MRNLNFLINNYPSTTLQASGPSVGLPWGERGNSEVGHMNLGAGRIISQDLPRINASISGGTFFQNPALLAAVNHAKDNNSNLHLAGLVSSGGVHSSEEHLYAIMQMAANAGVSRVFIHMFTDGRDTHPKVAIESLDRLSRKILEIGVGKIATVGGRFYAMDRGGHFDLTESMYKAMVLGEGNNFPSALTAIRAYYDQQLTDEVLPPTVITDAGGAPIAKVAGGDSIIFFNFRSDRMKQIFHAFTVEKFDKFSKPYPHLDNVAVATMTLYDHDQVADAAFPPTEIKNGLSEVVSRANLRQFHIAESEKYAHVTYFFNGGREEPMQGEEREIVSSPAAYQKRYEDVPQMSVDLIGTTVVDKIQKGINFILANVANPDMVGHTGNRTACIEALKAVDKNIGVIFEAVMAAGACLVLTSDHGNIEERYDPLTGEVSKEHSLNPVPLVVAGKGLEAKKVKSHGYVELASVVPEGVLSDVSPTVLDLMGLPKPAEMTSISLMQAGLMDGTGGSNP